MKHLHCDKCGAVIATITKGFYGSVTETIEDHKDECVPLTIPKARAIIKRLAPRILTLKVMQHPGQQPEYIYQPSDYILTAIRLKTGKMKTWRPAGT